MGRCQDSNKGDAAASGRRLGWRICLRKGCGRRYRARQWNQRYCGDPARYECGSIVISTNRAFRDWGAIFDVDNTLATAMIDRLMHHGEAIVIQGESYRTKDKPDN